MLLELLKFFLSRPAGVTQIVLINIFPRQSRPLIPYTVYQVLRSVKLQPVNPQLLLKTAIQLRRNSPAVGPDYRFLGQFLSQPLADPRNMCLPAETALFRCPQVPQQPAHSSANRSTTRPSHWYTQRYPQNR